MPIQLSSRRAWLDDALVLMVAAVWGSSYLATKEITNNTTVIPILLLRFLITVPILAVAVRRRAGGLTPRQLGGGVVLGLILTAIFLLETYGVVHISATNAGLIISLTMIFTPLAESVLSRSRPNATFLIAAVVSMGGIALLI